MPRLVKSFLPEQPSSPRRCQAIAPTFKPQWTEIYVLWEHLRVAETEFETVPSVTKELHLEAISFFENE